MCYSKIALILFKAIVEILLLCMKSMEQSGNVDADGLPLDMTEYNKLGFFLASVRDIIKENENFEKENEEQDI